MIRTTFLLLVGLLVTTQASAQNDAAEGRREFRAAVDAAEAGNWSSAQTRFERAFALTQRPIILLNLAAVHAELNDPRSAHQVLNRFLEEAPDNVREPQQDNVDSMMRELVAGAVQLRIESAEPSGEIFLDDEPVREGVEIVNPGTRYTLTLRVDGQQIDEQTFIGAAGEEQTVRLGQAVPSARDAARTVVGDEDPLDEASSGGNGLAIGLGIAAAVIVVATVVTLLLVLPSSEAPDGFEGNLGRIEL
ncbi:MAG: hypothetical protein AB8H86_24765 [Polyangiales bacterium]